MGIKLPFRIDAKKVAHAFITIQGASWLKKHLTVFGPKGLQWLVDHDIPIKDVLIFIYQADKTHNYKEIPNMAAILEKGLSVIQELSAQKLPEYTQQILSFGWAIRHFQPTEIYKLLPDWVQSTLQDERGQAWYLQTMDWVRDILQRGDQHGTG